MRHGVKGLLFGVLCWCVSAATAGAPSLNEDCRDRNKRPVPVRYESSARVFAEARQIGSTSRQAAILINPEVYFIGRQTQQWLYERQCVHIQQNHAVVRDGEKGLRLADEEFADCAALAAMDGAATSGRSLRTSIESDIQRLTRDNKWQLVLPGPPRRISLDRCPG